MSGIFGDHLFDAFNSEKQKETKSKQKKATEDPEALARAKEVINELINRKKSRDAEKTDENEGPEQKKRNTELHNDNNLINSLPRIQIHTVESVESCTHEVALPPEHTYVPLRLSSEKPVREYSFVLDPFQKEAILCLENNQSVLVSAHTSAGKTVVAEYAVAMSLKNKQRVIYTTPIKALSNQKYREFCEEFKDVGLMTGDVTINPSASCLIMTTEILRSMLYRGSEVTREVGWVVFDEIHYMRDKSRGVVWEETIILLPDNVHYVFLSATIPNARQFAEWICHLHKQPCHVVYTDYRPTPLEHYIFPAGGDGLHLVVDEEGKFREDNFTKAMTVLQNAGEAAKGDQKGRKGGFNQNDSNCFKIVKMIMEHDFAPVIVFSFSKKECEAYALVMAKLDFNTIDEKNLVEEVFKNAIDTLSDDDKKLPQVEHVLPLLKRGIGIHHSGLLPILKEVIEILFGEGLIKALFATETFAMGLNMPARTVLFTNARKFDGKDFRWLTSGEYIQMSGRAGRRGLDDKGLVMLMVDEKMSPAVGKNLVKGQADPINSAFHLTYNMVLNLLRVEEINPEYMLERSFFQFQHYSSIPSLYEKMDKIQNKLDSIQIENEAAVTKYHEINKKMKELSKEFHSYLIKPQNLISFLNSGRLVKICKDEVEYDWGVVMNCKKRTISKNVNEKSETVFIVEMLLHTSSDCSNSLTISSLKPCPPDEKGTMQVVPVLSHLITNISAIRIACQQDMRPLVHRLGVLKILAEIKRQFPDGVPLLDPIKDMGITDKNFKVLVRKIEAVEEQLRSHSLHNFKDKEILLERFKQKLSVMEEMKAAKGELRKAKSLLQMDELKCRKRVLRRLGYCSAADVIDIKGRVACEISSGDELLLTEMLFNGTFNEMTVPQCTALLSCFVFQEKSNELSKLTNELSGPLRQMQEIARHIAKVSVESRLELQEDEYVDSFRPNLMDVVYAWSKNAPFSEICKMTDVFEGSIIRCIRRLEELLRQMCQAAKAIGNVDLENKFAEGIRLIKRDIMSGVFGDHLFEAFSSQPQKGGKRKRITEIDDPEATTRVKQFIDEILNRKRSLDMQETQAIEGPEQKKTKKDLNESNLADRGPRIQIHTVETLEACTHEVALPPEHTYVPLRLSTEKPMREYSFILDSFQKEAILCLENNQSVLVSAHTSAGKTVVAEYAVAMSLKNKQRVIYTTPIKALSNQKYREFYEEFQDVGLMTGDVTINPSASCLIMTTEILRSMLYRGSEVTREVGWVIFDEIHYMRDKKRGVVWEETIILLPDNVHYVFLSATIPNARQFAEWICHLHKQPCHVVYTDYRPTPLEHYIFPAGGDGLHLVVDDTGQFREDNFNRAMSVLQNAGDAAKGDQKGRKGGFKQDDSNCFKIVKMIMEHNFAPVIVFSFSKKECEAYAMLMAKLDFNNADERRLVEEVFTNAIDTLSEDDKKLPQVEHVLPLLKRGIGIHHSGLLPILKEVIEILFGEGLIKALFATETFAMGLNMPARTVLFTSARKFDGKDFRWITSGEYIQMSGRAGRRGLDDKGIVMLMIDEKMSPAVGKNLVKGQADAINSAFHLTYTMVLNLLRVEEINPEYMLERSFYQFQNFASVPKLYEKTDEVKNKLDAIQIRKEDAVANYYHLNKRMKELSEEFHTHLIKPQYLLKVLQPGRMVKICNAGVEFDWGMVVNCKKQRDAKNYHKKCETTFVVEVLLHLSSDIKSDNISKLKPCPRGEKGEIEVVPVMTHLIHKISSGRIACPKNLRSFDNRMGVLKTIEEVQRRYPSGVPLLDPIEDMGITHDSFKVLVQQIGAVEEQLRSHSLYKYKNKELLLERFQQKSSIREELKAVKGELRKAKSLLQMDELKCRKRVLRRLGYCSAADVIDIKGRVACEITSGDELLLTEMLFSGIFNEMTAQQCTALLSCFVFQETSNEVSSLTTELSVPLSQMQEIARYIAKVSIESRLELNEDEYVNSFKPHVMDLVFAWSNNAPFSEICKMTDIFEGSIIRCIRRLEELLRQMCQAAKAIGNVHLENKFAEGIRLIKRDIVFAASLYL
uniref:Exosome RNA helicase MTR4 n=1 Tax=Strigamia maritima TaxID=126957 RepID=T1IR20_STRMM